MKLLIKLLEDSNNKLELLHKLEAILKGAERVSISDIQYKKDELMIRHWGQWELPDDEEEDDGDYDWEVLSEKSSKKLTEIITKFEKENNCKIVSDSSEKNWLYFKIK